MESPGSRTAQTNVREARARRALAGAKRLPTVSLPTSASGGKTGASTQPVPSGPTRASGASKEATNVRRIRRELGTRRLRQRAARGRGGPCRSRSERSGFHLDCVAGRGGIEKVSGERTRGCNASGLPAACYRVQAAFVLSSRSPSRLGQVSCPVGSCHMRAAATGEWPASRRLARLVVGDLENPRGWPGSVNAWLPCASELQRGHMRQGG